MTVKYIKDLKMHPEAADAMSEVLSGFHMLDLMMTRLGRCSAGTDISEAHDLFTTAWVAARAIRLNKAAPASSLQDEPEPETQLQPQTATVPSTADPFTSW